MSADNLKSRDRLQAELRQLRERAAAIEAQLGSEGPGAPAQDSPSLEPSSREHRSRQNERIYQAIGETIDYGIWVCDTEGRNVYVSQSFLKLVGLSQQECSEFGWRRVLHPEDAESTIEAWKECIRAGATWDMEHRFLGVDQQWHPVLARGVPVRDENGGIICWAGINLDISRLKQAEASLAKQASELQQKTRELERSNAELEQFASIVSHDLRSPLLSMTGCVELLAEQLGEKITEDDAELIKYVRQSVARMAEMIRALLDYARVGKSGVVVRAVNAQDLLKDVIGGLKGAIDQERAEVTSEALPTIHGDGRLLARVLQNLIENGIKYRGSEPPRIHVGIRAEREEWIVSVRDNGIGIPAQFVSRLFQVFQRLHNDDARYAGIGIGLAIAKKIVEQHGGRIWLESTPGEGTTFFFTLPRRDEVLSAH